MKVSPYKCDYCPETMKPGSPPWFLRPAGALGFYLMWWDPELAEVEQPNGKLGYEHICSQACAMKAMSKWASESHEKNLRGARSEDAVRQY